MAGRLSFVQCAGGAGWAAPTGRGQVTEQPEGTGAGQVLCLQQGQVLRPRDPARATATHTPAIPTGCTAKEVERGRGAANMTRAGIACISSDWKNRPRSKQHMAHVYVRVGGRTRHPHEVLLRLHDMPPAGVMQKRPCSASRAEPASGSQPWASCLRHGGIKQEPKTQNKK
jgi:hypothetical protein